MTSPDSDNPTSVFDSKLESILELLEEEDSQHFIYLTGAAGTGKTTRSYWRGCVKYWWQHN